MQHASGAHHKHQLQETLRQGEAGVTRSERGLASRSARCAARASQRASEVRPRTVGSPVDVLGPDELARRSMRAHGGARRDLLRSSRAWPTCVPLLALARKRRGYISFLPKGSFLPFPSCARASLPRGLGHPCRRAAATTACDLPMQSVTPAWLATTSCGLRLRCSRNSSGHAPALLREGCRRELLRRTRTFPSIHNASAH